MNVPVTGLLSPNLSARLIGGCTQGRFALRRLSNCLTLELMKKIEAIVKPFKMDEVKDALIAVGARRSIRPAYHEVPAKFEHFPKCCRSRLAPELDRSSLNRA